MTDQLTPEQQRATAQIIKLLNLAAKNDNPNEAAAANAKAQAMLVQYNLDAATLDHAQGAAEGKREKAEIEGGRNVYIRDLWRSVAELNFCLYWSQVFATDKRDKYGRRIYKRRHALVGKLVNTRSTVAIATYLEHAIERMAKERTGAEGWLLSSSWAWSFRSGAAETVCDRLAEERRDLIRKQRKKVPEGSSGSALTITDLAQQEKDANDDFLHGEGWSAQQRAERAKSAERRRLMQEAYTAWAAANPDAAMSKFKYVDDDGRTWTYGRPSYSGGTRATSRENVDVGGHAAGREAGKKIGLYAQAEGKKAPAGRITGSKDIAL